MSEAASAVRDLVEMGFSRMQAEAALSKTHGNKETALGLLLGSASMAPPDPSSLRAPGTCVALLHISGTAYINSLLQAYFAIPVLCKAILSFSAQPDSEPDLTRDSVNLLFSLQRLFAQLALSERKAVDPSHVLARMRDDAGKQVFIGDESYVGEFSTWFISQLEDGFKAERTSGQGCVLDFHTLRHRESFRSLSESEMITDSCLAKLFFGKLTEELHSLSGETQKVITKEALFAQFGLSAAYGDLVTSWQAIMTTTVADYRSSAGEITPCQQFSWISTLPKVLLFQISHESSKKAFNYPMTLYADQFLLSNAEQVNSLRKEADRIQLKVAFLQRKLEKIENFKQSRQNLEAILRLADGFVTDQRTNMDYTVLEDDQVQVYSPACLFAVTEAAEQQLKSASSLLDLYIVRTKDRVAAIKGQIVELNGQMEQLYSSFELRKHPFKLHAVLTHEGSSGSGCYSAYIHSPDSLQWRKFSDEVVTEVLESRVVEEGRSQYSQVYCLLYLAEELAQGWGAHSFDSYVPSSIRRNIEIDNRKLQQDNEDKQLSLLYSQITTRYTERQNQATLQKSSSRPFLDLLNFPIYLKTREEEMLSRWVLLDLCVQEVTSKSLAKVAGEPLGLKLKTMSVGQAVISLRITGTEERRVKELLRQYEEGYKDAMALEFILLRLNELDFANASIGFSCILSQASPGKNHYRAQARDLVEVLALRLTSEVRNCCIRQETEKGIQLLKLLGALTFLYIDEKLLLFRQVVYNLESICRSGEMQGKVGDLVRRVKAQDPGFIVDLPPSTPLIDSLKQQLQDYKGYRWVLGWQSDQLACRLSGLTRTFQGLYAPWLDLQGLLKRTNQVVADSVREELELRADYLLKSP